ncbi:helix-turn-helix transcriptional regulator [Streptomyces sp. NPDC017890]|uniref:helix-turn-helix transcriptional regulator n=1 Tax=Streptomyces sp. NPDC017890 TaxID=3365015 RepID=UPI0037A2F387
MTDPEAATGHRSGTGRAPVPAPRSRAADDPLLTLLGLGADEDAVYHLLVDRADSEPADLAGRLDPAQIQLALNALVERGLASVHREQPDGRPRYRAASPLLALGPLLEARRTALHRAEFLVTDLAERHRMTQVRGSGAPVEVLSGATAIRRRLIAMQQRARREVCALVPLLTHPAAISAVDNFDVAERDSMARGVLQRSVVVREYLEQGGGDAALLRQLVSRGQQIAVVDEVPIKMVMVDRQVALLPLDPERDETEPTALVVHRSGLLTALVALFERCFAEGTLMRAFDDGGPAGDGAGRAGQGDGIDALDRRILTLLRVGLTDAAIARQVGVGHRTVQRRLSALMRRTGATTRFQLGWHTARTDWLD